MNAHPTISGLRRLPCVLCGVLLATTLPIVARAQDIADLLPAQCAAFLYGRDDFAQVSAYLDRNDQDAVLAGRFRDAAVAANSGEAGPVDEFIASERGAMAWLVEAAILGDPQSRDLHDRLVARCAGDDLP
jgi:hypothetical protein